MIFVTNLPHQLDKLLIWHRVPGQELAHARWRFLATSVHVAFCSHDVSANPQPADERAERCPVCQYVIETVHAACLDVPRHQTFSDHPMIAEVHAAFEAAGGRWAALQPGPLDWRAIQREMEAIVREHIDNPQVLLREVTGYLELAIAAAQRQTVAELAEKDNT